MQYTIGYRPTFVMLDVKGVALVYSIFTCPSNNHKTPTKEKGKNFMYTQYRHPP
jgi:hypothetical protein